MQPARIAELLQPFLPRSCDRPFTDDDLFNISTYIDLLRRWNSRINLTAIRDEEEIVTRHFGESFFAAAHLFPSRGDVTNSSPAPTVADVGSGAGFPGIPIKIWAPEISLTLIESNHKKATFLREVVRSLRLTNIDILNARAEELSQTFDLMTLRAVESFTKVLPIAARLVGPSGRVAFMISSAQVAPAAAALRLNWRPSIPVPQSDSRVLLIGEHRK